MMTEKEISWHQQLKIVLQKLPQAVSAYGYRHGCVQYIATHLAKEMKQSAQEGVPTYQKSDIEWIIYEMIELGRFSADAGPNGEFSNLKVVDNDSAKAQQVAIQLKSQLDLVKSQVDGFRKAAEQALQREKEALETAELAKKAAAETKSQSRVVEVQLKNGVKTVKKTAGIFHKEFEKMIKLAKSRENIFIYGPSGCGKTYVSEQLAQVLDLPFGFGSCTAGMTEGQITARLMPSVPDEKILLKHYNSFLKQKIEPTAAATLAAAMISGFSSLVAQYADKFENGGVWLWDEFDGMDPNISLLMNASLSNGMLAMPNRPENPYARRHKDFVCIAAANTVGTGGDRMYSGRNKLDLALLERFAIGKIFMDYDPVVESTLCPDEELRTRLLRYRRGINAHRLERAMTSRFMEKAYHMVHNEDEACRFTVEEVDLAFFQGWREDEMNKVKYFK
jgi:MoxR-like ATPase